MSPRLRAYLALELAAMQLDEGDDPLADIVRDAIDPIWYALSENEQERLNARLVRPLLTPAPIELRVGARLFIDPPSSPAEKTVRAGPIEVGSWRDAA